MSGKASRVKGHVYERQLCTELWQWFPDVVTSRSESRRADDKMKDLMYTGKLCIQAKCVETSPSYPIILKKMKENFPDEIPLIFRKQSRKPETVSMLKSDFYKFIAEIIKHE